MRLAISSNSSFGVKSTRRLTKLKRTPRTAGGMQGLQFVVGDAALDGGDAARLAVRRDAGIDHRTVVGAMAGGLHDDVAREAKVVAQGEEAGPCWHHTACTCARVQTGTDRRGRRHGSARRRRPTAAGSWACSGLHTSPASRGFFRKPSQCSFFFRCWSRRSASVRQSALRAKGGLPRWPKTPASARVGNEGPGGRRCRWH